MSDTTDTSATEQSILDALRATATLADVSVGVWSGERTDASALTKVKSDAGAIGNVGRLLKNLMAGADGHLKAAKSAFHYATQLHRELTLPWSLDSDRMRGPRLLPNAHAMSYLERMGEAKKWAETALQTLLDNYDADVAIAKHCLGTLAAAADYPSKDAVREMFYIRVAIEPLPATGGFRNLPPAFAESLARNLKTRQERMLSQSQAVMWQQIREHVEDWRERLSDPERRFKDAFITNAQDVMNRVQGWNLAGDARVEAFLTAWRNEGMHLVTPEVLRKKVETRAPVAEAAGRLLQMLDGWNVGKDS